MPDITGSSEQVQEKALGKVLQTFMIQILKKLRLDGKYQYNKGQGVQI